MGMIGIYPLELYPLEHPSLASTASHERQEEKYFVAFPLCSAELEGQREMPFLDRKVRMVEV